MVFVVSSPESEATPLAGCWGMLMSTIQLDVLHWVAQRKLIHTCASCHFSMDFYDRQTVNQLLSIRQVSDS